MPELTTHYHQSSEEGLSSISTLIVGEKGAVLIDPPFLIPDAESIIKWVKNTTPLPLKAVFVTHHHPDHFFSANPILEAWPEAKFLAAPYVRDAIDREYEAKVGYWPAKLGYDKIPKQPRKPDSYRFTFFTLEGNETSPIVLLGPVQGDAIDMTLFWLPVEKTVICGDVIYARSTHVWVEEVETPAVLYAWQTTLDLLDSLHATKIIPGHMEAGWELDGQADLEHTRKYLKLFAEKITNAPKKPQIKDLYDTFKNAFPQADKNLDFFLGHLSNQFGEGGEIWEENQGCHDTGERTKETLEGYVL